MKLYNLLDTKKDMIKLARRCWLDCSDITVQAYYIIVQNDTIDYCIRSSIFDGDSKNEDIVLTLEDLEADDWDVLQ